MSKVEKEEIWERVNKTDKRYKRPIKIDLSPDDDKWLREHTENIVDYYGGEGSEGSGVYHKNSFDSNLLGVKAERAVELWLYDIISKEKQDKIDPQYLNISSEDYKNYAKSDIRGDIVYGTISLEVKALRPNQWNKFKRMVPPSQLSKYISQDSIIIWATTYPDSHQVSLHGWNTASDFKDPNKIQYITTICDNIWIPDDKNMYSMSSLAKILQNHK